MVIYDAVVVGGGIAGSTVALELGRRGARVALLEKAHFPRPKACGEGLLPHGVAALKELGVEPHGVPVRGLRFVSPAGRTAQADFPRGHGVVVRRTRFDEQLFRTAAATPNVEAFEGALYDAERWRSDFVVGADGIHSQFHRRPAFLASPPKVHRVGLSTHVSGLDVDRERVEVILHSGGEVYLAPSDGDEALVACLFRKEDLPPGESAEARVTHVLRSLHTLRHRIDTLRFTTPVLGASPLGLSVRAATSGNMLLVGDAAGAPDPVTGEGMSLAILSARAAADAILSGRLSEYEQQRRDLASGAEWLGRWLLRAARHPIVAERVVRSLARKPALFTKLLEVATGLRTETELRVMELAQLVV